MKKAILKLLLFIPLLAAVVTPIIWVDPLHLFDRTHDMNNDFFFDQRLIKCNIIRYEQPDYNSLIIGSSRIQRTGNMQVGDYHFFNFGLGDLMLADNPGFIDLAQSYKKGPLRCMVISMDMYGSSVNRCYDTHWGSTEQYVQDSQNWGYLSKLLISPKSFKYSAIKIYKKMAGIKKSTDRPPFKLSDIYYNKVFSQYKFDARLVTQLLKLQADYPDTRLVFLTTPVSVKHFNMMQQHNRVPDCLAWIKILSQTVDTVYNFMDITPLTTQRNNWFDANHTDPHIMQQQIRSVLLNEQGNPNFSIITAQNADSILTAIENRIANYDLARWADE